MKSVRASNAGMTLIEIVIIVLIGGLLALIVTGQFFELRRRAEESALKGHLAVLRGAVLAYFGDNRGKFPPSLDAMTKDGRYLERLPSAPVPPAPRRQNPGHRDPVADAVSYEAVPSTAAAFVREGDALWGYVTSTTSAYGHVFVNCYHKDALGSAWSSW